MLVFILKSAITLALLYSCFFILLSKETFHRFNRVMLLGIMVAAFIVPMLHITTEHPTIINKEVQLIENMTDRGIVFIYEDEATEPQPQINWVQVMMWVYLTGVAVMLIITLIEVINLVRLMHRGIQQKDEQGNTIILINGEISPFSIFHFIVMSVKDYESGRQYILTHEQEHIRLGHSYDLLLMQVLKTTQWFNPFVWFISRDLKTIHEYEADQAVINQGIDAKQYQLFLVKKVVGNRLQPFTNNLNHGSLKKRIAMMYQKKSNRWLMLKALFAIPVIALTISAFATPAAMKPVEELVKTIEEQTSPSFVLQDEREILANEVSNEPSNLLAPIGETGKGSEGVPDIKPGQ
ncbi:MAG: M56 family metallopeptidase, partial [Bacteroidaceae bacterium]|nr:M56 family metallopeptidase [Bacteroidaceae bacterium]